MKEKVEFLCPACQKESILKREPVYEGFRRIGEKLSCLLCRHVFADEAEIPFQPKASNQLFDESDKSKPTGIFSFGEADQICRHCIDYVVNPFIQRCGRTQKIVEATDSCDFFTPRPIEKKPENPPS